MMTTAERADRPATRRAPTAGVAASSSPDHAQPTDEQRDEQERQPPRSAPTPPSAATEWPRRRARASPSTAAISDRQRSAPARAAGSPRPGPPCRRRAGRPRGRDPGAPSSGSTASSTVRPTPGDSGPGSTGSESLAAALAGHRQERPPVSPCASNGACSVTPSGKREMRELPAQARAPGGQAGLRARAPRRPCCGAAAAPRAPRSTTARPPAGGPRRRPCPRARSRRRPGRGTLRASSAAPAAADEPLVEASTIERCWSPRRAPAPARAARRCPTGSAAAGRSSASRWATTTTMLPLERPGEHAGHRLQRARARRPCAPLNTIGRDREAGVVQLRGPRSAPSAWSPGDPGRRSG